MLILLACTTLECGPGTQEADGQCLPARMEAPAADSAPADTSDTGIGDSEADSPAADDSSAESVDSSGDSNDSEPPEAPPLAVYLLAGQSNMDGYGWYPGLAPSEQSADPRVPLYWSGWGEFRDLQAASYGGNVYFGPEVTFGRTLADAGRSVALVKHAVGGTDLAYYWYPGAAPGDGTAGEGFTGLAATVSGATRALDANGEPWEWGGLVWMQGESDSLDIGMAMPYADNLENFIGAVRTLTGAPELPVVVGLISRETSWTYADIVREAESTVADADPFVVTVETDDLPRNVYDTAHYDGVSTRVLGRRFARAILESSEVPAGDDAPAAAFTLSSGASAYDFTGTCGWEFTTSTPIEITDLGAYGSSYLYTSADVGLWDADGNLLLRSNVPSWTEAPATFRGSVWYVAVEPLRLEAGTYRLGLVSWSGDADRYLNDATGTFAPGIAYSAGVYAEGSWLLYPSASVVTGAMNFLGPDFLFVPG